MTTRTTTTTTPRRSWHAVAAWVSAVCVFGALLITQPVAAVAPTEICIGLVLPLTGSHNLEALRMIDAVRMGADDMTNDPKWMPGTAIHVIDDLAAIDSANFVRFAARRMYDQVTTKTCVNGTRPVVVIGDMTDVLVEEMAPIASLMSTPIMSPGARDPEFTTDRVSHPFVAVFRSSLKDEAAAMLAMFRRMGWTQFVLWHSNSAFGSSLTDTFAQSGLEMVNLPISAFDQGKEIDQAIERIHTMRVRVIVVHAEPELARLMMNLSQRAGVLNGDYLFFGSMTWTWGTDESAAVFNEQEKAYLQGVMGLSIPVEHNAELAFQQRLRARKPLLYPPYFPDSPMNPLGVGYDAVKAIGLAVKNLTARGLPASGQDLMDALIAPNIDFMGVLGGRVQMTQETGSRVSRYHLTNFQSGQFQIVGTWTLAQGLVMDPTQRIIWPGNNEEEVPSQQVPRRLLNTTWTLKDAAVAVGCLYGLASLLLHYLIYLNTDHEVIKASSPIFCHIILAGGDIAYVMCALSALSPDTACQVVPPLIALCFSLIFGALVAKTYRIHRIFNSSELRIKTPTNSHLFAICGVLLAYDLLIIGLWMGTDEPHSAYIESPNDSAAAYQGCVMNDSTSWTMALLIPKAVLILFGAYLAYKVRDLNHNFNEARYISLALYNVLIMAGILFGLVSAFPYSVDVVYALKSMGVASCAFITMLILFAPKFWDVYITKDWIDYHSNSSYVSGVLVHKSSKGSYAKHVQAAVSGAAVGADGKPVPSVNGLTADTRRGDGTGLHQRTGKRSGADPSPYITATGRTKKAGAQQLVSPTQRSGSASRGATTATSKPAAALNKLPGAVGQQSAQQQEGLVALTISPAPTPALTTGSAGTGAERRVDRWAVKPEPVSTPSIPSALAITRTRSSPPQEAEFAGSVKSLGPAKLSSASTGPGSATTAASPSGSHPAMSMTMAGVAGVAVAAATAISSGTDKKSPTAAPAGRFGYRVAGSGGGGSCSGSGSAGVDAAGSFHSMNPANTAPPISGGSRNPMSVNQPLAPSASPTAAAAAASASAASAGGFSANHVTTYAAGDGYRSYPSLHLDTPSPALIAAPAPVPAPAPISIGVAAVTPSSASSSSTSAPVVTADAGSDVALTLPPTLNA